MQVRTAATMDLDGGRFIGMGATWEIEGSPADELGQCLSANRSGMADCRQGGGRIGRIYSGRPSWSLRHLPSLG